jgi:toxin ParE1/3/4
VPQIRYTRRARDDLLDIWLHIAADDPGAADAAFARIEARIAVLADFPELAPLRPEIAPGARVLVARPYLILYRALPLPEGVQVVRVLHGARDIDADLFGEGLGREGAGDGASA